MAEEVRDGVRVQREWRSAAASYGLDCLGEKALNCLGPWLEKWRAWLFAGTNDQPLFADIMTTVPFPLLPYSSVTGTTLLYRIAAVPNILRIGGNY